MALEGSVSEIAPARAAAVICSGDWLFMLPLFWRLLFKYRAETAFVVR
jgi:hypothetical protein